MTLNTTSFPRLDLDPLHEEEEEERYDWLDFDGLSSNSELYGFSDLDRSISNSDLTSVGEDELVNPTDGEVDLKPKTQSSEGDLKLSKQLQLKKWLGFDATIEEKSELKRWLDNDLNPGKKAKPNSPTSPTPHDGEDDLKPKLNTSKGVPGHTKLWDLDLQMLEWENRLAFTLDWY